MWCGVRYVLCVVWCDVCGVMCAVCCVVCGMWCGVRYVVCGVMWCVWCVVCGSHGQIKAHRGPKHFKKIGAPMYTICNSKYKQKYSIK